jgi:hypothetical protein
MAWTKQQIQQYIENTLADDLGWSWSQWNDEAIRRSVHIKYDHQLATLQAMYETKLIRMVKRYKRIRDEFSSEFSSVIIDNEESVTLTAIKEKAVRLVDKWRTVNKEIEGRSLGHFNRDPIGTVYYIDLDGGNDGADGLGTGTAWLTIEKYTTTTVRSGGDIAYVRANTDEIPAGSIAIDEDGTFPILPISIIGCDSVTNDPWSDGSDVKPIIDFNAQVNRLEVTGDDLWIFKRLDIKDSANVSQMIQVVTSRYTYFEDCDFSGASASKNLETLSAYPLKFKGCTFTNADDINLGLGDSRVVCEDCDFDGGGNATDYGIKRTASHNDITLIDCNFGQNTAHTVSDLDIPSCDVYRVRNTQIDYTAIPDNHPFWIIDEDVDGTYGDHYQLIHNVHEITKDTGVTRSGGASSSAKMEIGTRVTTEFPMKLSMAGNDIVFPFSLWLRAAAHTVSIYIRSIDAWAAYPTNSQLFVKALYLDHAVNASRTAAQSTAVLSHASNWVEFDVTFTSQQAGFVYLDVHLSHYEANKGCYVDIKPVVS